MNVCSCYSIICVNGLVVRLFRFFEENGKKKNICFKESGHLTVNYTDRYPKFYNRIFIRWLKTFGNFAEL